MIPKYDGACILEKSIVQGKESFYKAKSMKIYTGVNDLCQRNEIMLTYHCNDDPFVEKEKL